MQMRRPAPVWIYKGNSEVADYVVDAVVGSFALSANPQNFVLDPPEGSTVLGVCPVPTF